MFHQLHFRTTLNIQITNIPASQASRISLAKSVIVFGHEVKENLHEEIYRSFIDVSPCPVAGQAGNFASFIWLTL